MKRRNFLSSVAVGAVTAPFMLHAHGVGQTEKRYRACVIGDTQRGGYGHSLHLMWALRDDVEVVALADPDEEGRAQRAQEANAAVTYADYREMLEKEMPDLVAIGPRWTVHHKEYLLACAEVGAHGIVEKPLTPDLAEADAVLAAMKAKNLKWTMAFNFRASPEIAHAKKMLFEEELIGEILEVRGRGKEDHRAGGEDLVVLGVHNFDMMRYFLGDAEWCMSHISVDGAAATAADVREASEPLGPIVGDSIHAVYGFKGGIPGSFASMKNEIGHPGRWGLDIFGSTGMATIRMANVPLVAYIEESSWAPAGRRSQWQRLPDRPTITPREPERIGHYAPIIDDLIAAIEEDREPAVSLRDGLAATEMIQAAFEAHVLGERVSMPLENREHPLTRW